VGFCTPPPEQIAAALACELIRETRPEPLSALAQLAAVARLALDTSLHRRPGLRWTAARDAEHAVLKLLDKTVTFPANCEGALKIALSGNTFTPRELPGLESVEQLVLTRRLLHEGVVVPIA
jgi:hypothetical protein